MEDEQSKALTRRLSQYCDGGLLRVEKIAEDEYAVQAPLFLLDCGRLRDLRICRDVVERHFTSELGVDMFAWIHAGSDGRSETLTINVVPARSMCTTQCTSS
jgi:hypothetical protein